LSGARHLSISGAKYVPVRDGMAGDNYDEQHCLA
jgi:hypothetical protein